MSDTTLRRRPELSRNFLAQEIAVARSADFMEALVAACAIMAHADGEVARTERRRFYAVARNEPTLAVFSHADVIEEFALHEAQYNFDPEIAHELAVEKLQAVRDRASDARAILQACRNILAADGIAHPSEMRAMATIRTILGVAQPSA